MINSQKAALSMDFLRLYGISQTPRKDHQSSIVVMVIVNLRIKLKIKWLIYHVCVFILPFESTQGGGIFYRFWLLICDFFNNRVAFFRISHNCRISQRRIHGVVFVCIGIKQIFNHKDLPFKGTSKIANKITKRSGHSNIFKEQMILQGEVIM